MKSWQKTLLAAAAVVLVGCLLLFAIPPIRERVVWRVDQLRIRLQYTFNPPEEDVFVPDRQAAAVVQATITQMAALVTPSATAAPTSTPTPLPPDVPTATPTLEPTPLPEAVTIPNVPYVDQHYGFNNCAPANLTLTLNFWGSPANRESVAEMLKPFAKDKNVMPYEMTDMVNRATDLRALDRNGGDLALLKRLVAGGFPVIVESGVYLRDLTGKISWMGHYQTVYGYDDAAAQVQIKDTFQPDGERFIMTYADLLQSWRSFNYAFVVVYPPDREAEVLALLGPYADPLAANQIAAQTASNEIFQLEGQDKFFAWFNRGSSLTWLQDYGGGAQAFDEAFKVYAELPAESRPWRVTWYQTGPYFAYYYSGRYYDVLALTDQTLNAASEPYLEENFYWRARAKLALGDDLGAAEDLRQSIAYHPGFGPAVEMMNQMGVAP